MEKILISACLLGVNCKYSGGSSALKKEQIEALCARYQLIPVCPESYGGLPTPRPPSEIVGERVLSRNGEDVTEQFNHGARAAERLAEVFGVRRAVLKERSPSCGHDEVYDGSFSGKTVPGDGVAARLLKEMGVEIFGESDVPELIK